MTLISYGRSVLESLAAAKTLEGEGISAEVIDLRTLVPLDVDTMVESVRRTGRAVVVHDAVQFAGPGAEIVAVLQAECFGDLSAPIERVAARFVPTPAAAVAGSTDLSDGGARRRGCADGRSTRRVPVPDFLIRIPRVSVAVSEAELTELLVEAGEHVDEGTPIYTIATEKVEQEIEAGASGTVQWTGTVGTTYDIGAEIGVITS